MKSLLTSLVVLALFSCNVLAGFAGYTTGQFQNPVGGPDAVVSGVGTNHIVTGKPTFLIGSKTELDYTGMPFSGQLGSAFQLGQLSFKNGLTKTGTSITGITLAIETTFTDPAYFQDVYDVGLNFDFHTFADSLVMENAGTKYSIGNSGYDIEILGFGGLCGYTDTFTVLETCTDSKNIYAKITGSPVVPAPGAVILGGLGVSIVGWIRRKKDC